MLLLCVCFICDLLCDAVGLSSLRVCISVLNVVYCMILYGVFVLVVCRIRVFNCGYLFFVLSCVCVLCLH